MQHSWLGCDTDKLHNVFRWNQWKSIFNKWTFEENLEKNRNSGTVPRVSGPGIRVRSVMRRNEILFHFYILGVCGLISPTVIPLAGCLYEIRMTHVIHSVRWERTYTYAHVFTLRHTTSINPSHTAWRSFLTHLWGNKSRPEPENKLFYASLFKHT